MKKIIYFLSISLLALTGCKDDETVYLVNPKDDITTLLLGKWNMVKGELYANGELVQSGNLSTEGCDYDYFVIKTGGLKDEVYHDGENNCATDNYEGTWTYNSENKIVSIVDAEDGYLFEAEILSITPTDIKLKIVSEGGDRPEDQGLEAFYYLKK